MSDWIEIGFSFSEVTGILEYVFVGFRKWSSSEDEKLNELCS